MAKAKKRKKWLWITLLIILLVGGGIFYKFSSRAAVAAGPHIFTAIVKQGTLRVHVYASGSVQANRTVDIKCQAGGQIVKLPYQLGQAVKKNDLLVEVDPKPELQAVTIAKHSYEQAKINYETAKLNLRIAQQNLVNDTQTDQANLISAQAQVENDKLNLSRDVALLGQKLVSEQTYDDDKTTLVRDQQAAALMQVKINQLATEKLQVRLQEQAVSLSKVQMQSQHEGLKQARLDLSYTKVYSQINGLVSSVLVQPGQIISSAITNVGGGTDIMDVVDLSRIFVMATVSESDINRVHRGEHVLITAAGEPGHVFHGVVDLIGPVGTADSKTNAIGYQVKIEVHGKDKRELLPGMTADVDILAKRLHNILFIPLQAVMIHHAHDTVDLEQAAGVFKPITVSLGMRNDRNWQVLGGLKKGQKLRLHLGDAMSRWRSH